MTTQQSFILLTASGDDWETIGPFANAFATLKEAEAAARDVLARFPKRRIGVYELREVFDTQERIVRQKIETPTARILQRKIAAARRKAPEVKPSIEEAPAENVVKLRSTN